MFISLTAIFLFLLIVSTSRNTILNNRFTNKMVLWIFMLILTYYITFREYRFSDAGHYVYRYKEFGTLSLSNSLDRYPGDPLFLILQWVLAKAFESPLIFLIVFWLAFALFFMKFISRLFQDNFSRLIIFFSYASFPFFFSLATNVMRQGLATGILLIALVYYLRSERAPYLLLLLIGASLMHWSAIPFSIIVLLLHKFKISLKAALFVWIVTALLFATDMQQAIMGRFLPYIPKSEVYLSSYAIDAYSGGTNRIDFFLFSFFWIVLALLINKFYFTSLEYQRLITIYTLFNSVFLLLGFIAYSDRIALYSWILIPILLWYPILKAEKRNQFLTFALLFGFTIIGYFSNSFQYFGF